MVSKPKREGIRRVFFNVNSYGGALSILNENTFALVFDSYGPQMFSGSVNTPTIVPGVYSVSSVFHGPATGTVTISAPASVPEPSSGPLMIVGLASALGVATRRRQRAA